MGPDKNDRRTPRKRRYPPAYERAVPIALGIIVLFIIALLVIIVGVALGMFPGMG